ncbi:transcription termination factor, mitochondrial [Diorhabda carinulata]|uniref:transcription termination factor, mitochondrial n=1 Tax=Diorhabda carinulata TaxID=1163345 RepID=UPI0025A2A14A|nr:transcription termination factor, mitochondrial [Diorhabda carinulata]
MLVQIVQNCRNSISYVCLRKLCEKSSLKNELLKTSIQKVNKTTKSIQDIENNYKLCLNKGITEQTIDCNPEILTDKSLVPKLDILKLLPLDINLSAPLLTVSYPRLKNFIFNEIVEKKISELAQLLKVNQHDVCVWMSKKNFLMTTNMDNMEKSIKILLDAGVSRTAIIKDLWVLRYNPDNIKDRIIFARQNNIETIKTWMVRAQREIIENYAKRRSDNKEILGEKESLVEYLSEKLECSQDISRYLIFKQPALQKKSLRKIEVMIEFLLQKGFTPRHICKTPKILLHSVDTVKKRIKEIETNNIHLDSLVMLTKSQRQYMHFLETVKCNKSKLKSSFMFYFHPEMKKKSNIPKKL